MGRRGPYNPNTKYGRRKLREEAQWNYDNGTQEHRDSIDEITNWGWVIAIVVAIVIFMLIYASSGQKAAMHWLSH